MKYIKNIKSENTLKTMGQSKDCEINKLIYNITDTLR